MLLDSFPVEEAEQWLVTWGFAGEAFETLRAYAQEVSFPERATIFSESDPSDGMYLVLSGMALIHQGPKALGVVTEGQSFGELGLLMGVPRHATVTAGLDIKLLKITPEKLALLEQERPDLMMKLYKALAQTLAEQWLRATKRK